LQDTPEGGAAGGQGVYEAPYNLPEISQKPEDKEIVDYGLDDSPVSKDSRLLLKILGIVKNFNVRQIAQPYPSNIEIFPNVFF